MLSLLLHDEVLEMVVVSHILVHVLIFLKHYKFLINPTFLQMKVLVKQMAYILLMLFFHSPEVQSLKDDVLLLPQSLMPFLLALDQ